MKKIQLLFLFIFFIITSCQSQDFEGEIVYLNEYKSKVPQVKDDQLDLFMGKSQSYFYKNGNYKSEMNGQIMQWQLYINKENKLYSKMANSETVLWNDAGIQADEVLDAKVNKNVLEILGYTCDELILTCKSGTQKYYYSSKINIDPKQFIKHKFGNWYDFVSRSNALPLKMIINNPQFTMISTATEITPKKLSESMFTLPAGTKIKKSPY